MNFLEHSYQYRVRYADTDQMKVVYHGNYARFFEIGRVEMLRNIGLPYKKLEANGIGLAVVNMNISFRKPAFYDDFLHIHTFLKEFPIDEKLIVHQEIYNESNTLITLAQVELFYLDLKNFKRTKIPDLVKSVFLNLNYNHEFKKI